MPKISVIVPVYKVEKYLNRCVDSILNQTFTDFELILVDDGSPDNCGKICDEYAEKDNRVVIIHKENGGLSSARNAGIDWAFANSDSEYIAFVDSDDWVHEQYLEKLYYNIITNKADLAICDFLMAKESGHIYSVGTKIYDSILNKNDCLSKLNANWKYVVVWNKLYKKILFDNLRFIKGKLHEDEFLIHHIIGASKRIVSLNLELYYYFQRDDSIMKTESYEGRLDLFEAWLDRCYYMNAPYYYFNNRYESLFFECLSNYSKSDIIQKRRFKYLKKKYRKIFFTNDCNRTLKKHFWYDFNKLYNFLKRVKRVICRK